MNTVAKSARIERTTTRKADAGTPGRGIVRRIATWWSNDSVTSLFAAERARDERLVRPGRC